MSLGGQSCLWPRTFPLGAGHAFEFASGRIGGDISPCHPEGDGTGLTWPQQSALQPPASEAGQVPKAKPGVPPLGINNPTANQHP